MSLPSHLVQRISLFLALSACTLSASAQDAATSGAGKALSDAMAANAASAAASASASKKSKDDEVVHINEADPAMREAFKKAQASFDGFLRTVKLNPKKIDVASVKIVVRDGKTLDYVWLLPFEQTKTGFTGLVNSLAVKIPKIQVNEERHFKRADVVDWMYVGSEDKLMHGNFTTCVLLRNAPAKDVADMKSRYGLDCANPLDH